MVNPPRQNRLTKKERLTGTSTITRMLSLGKFGFVGGLKYCFVQNNRLSYNRLLISVSKRFFKRAVVRNLLKRRIREAYRTSKELLVSKGTDLFIMYSTKEILTSEQIKTAMQQILPEISKRINQGNNEQDLANS